MKSIPLSTKLTTKCPWYLSEAQLINIVRPYTIQQNKPYLTKIEEKKVECVHFIDAKLGKGKNNWGNCNLAVAAFHNWLPLNLGSCSDHRCATAAQNLGNVN